jgi:hypothetical protein
MTFGCSLKSGAALSIPRTLTTRRMLEATDYRSDAREHSCAARGCVSILALLREAEKRG